MNRQRVPKGACPYSRQGSYGWSRLAKGGDRRWELAPSMRVATTIVVQNQLQVRFASNKATNVFAHASRGGISMWQ